MFHDMFVHDMFHDMFVICFHDIALQAQLNSTNGFLTDFLFCARAEDLGYHWSSEELSIDCLLDYP